MFNYEIEKELKELGLNEIIECFNKDLIEYEKRYIKIIKPQDNRPKTLTGQNALHYIQLLIYRSKSLFNGCINSLNSKDILNCYISIRCHLETTGAIAYLYRKLNSYYKGFIKYDDLDKNIFRQLFGTKIQKDRNSPEPINVLTLIEEADKFCKNKVPKEIKMFRESYDELSEYLHPNSYGIIRGCKINSVAIVRYIEEDNLDNEPLGYLHFLEISISIFFEIYDKIYELLKTNEELPIIIRKN